MSVELTTFIQCIDCLLATIAVDIPQQSLVFLIQVLRASRQICGLEWDRDNLSVFDGLC